MRRWGGIPRLVILFPAHLSWPVTPPLWHCMFSYVWLRAVRWPGEADTCLGEKEFSNEIFAFFSTAGLVTVPSYQACWTEGVWGHSTGNSVENESTVEFPHILLWMMCQLASVWHWAGAGTVLRASQTFIPWSSGWCFQISYFFFQSFWDIIDM